jgi:DUF1365 family protein
MVMVRGLQSAIYEGMVRHRRHTPKYHGFTYSVFMVYLDLDEIDSVFSKSPLWSNKYFSLAWFRRKDFFDGNDKENLRNVVSDKVYAETGKKLDGPIRVLTNLRYFGFIINPITCYYCFDKTGENLQAIVAEVTNTPWRNRCHYVLDFFDDSVDGIDKKNGSKKQQITFNKSMHVSPFQPMNLVYDWRGQQPAEDLVVHMDVYGVKEVDGQQEKDGLIFDATLRLKRQEMTRQKMNRVVLFYPWMTLKVCWGIYWQALKLWCKGIPFHRYPSDSELLKNDTINNKNSAGDKNAGK